MAGTVFVCFSVSDLVSPVAAAFESAIALPLPMSACTVVVASSAARYRTAGKIGMPPCSCLDVGRSVPVWSGLVPL